MATTCARWRAARRAVIYRGAGDLAVANVTAGALDAAGAPQAVSASGVTAGNAFVRSTSGNLSVAAASAAAGALMLQADTGNVTLGQSVQAATVALLAGGDIGQGAAGAIAADELLARSSGGGVGLDQAPNRVGTLAGGARDAFAYADVDALRIGEVSLPTPGAGRARRQVPNEASPPPPRSCGPSPATLRWMPT